MTLTNERRQALIADCQEEIGHLKEHISRLAKHHVDFDLSKYESQLQRQEIARASLKADTSKLAELAAKVRSVREDASEFDGDRRGMWEHQEEQEQLLLEEAVKYTAPPVSVIKFPGISELINAGGAMPAVRDVQVWELALSEIKRLNGLGE